MINAGDELGRSQGGNNNAYCQDNETSWIDWDLEPWQEDLLATTRHVARVRRDLPALRQRVWALGRQVHDDGTRDMEWYAADGRLMGHRWDDPGVRVVQMYVAGAWLAADSALVVVNGGREETEVVLPVGTGRHGIPAALGQRVGASAAGCRGARCPGRSPSPPRACVSTPPPTPPDLRDADELVPGAPAAGSAGSAGTASGAVPASRRGGRGAAARR